MSQSRGKSLVGSDAIVVGNRKRCRSPRKRVATRLGSSQPITERHLEDEQKSKPHCVQTSHRSNLFLTVLKMLPCGIGQNADQGGLFVMTPLFYNHPVFWVRHILSFWVSRGELADGNGHGVAVYPSRISSLLIHISVVIRKGFIKMIGAAMLVWYARLVTFVFAKGL